METFNKFDVLKDELVNNVDNHNSNIKKSVERSRNNHCNSNANPVDVVNNMRGNQIHKSCALNDVHDIKPRKQTQRRGKGKSKTKSKSIPRDINIAFNNVNGCKYKKTEIKKLLYDENIDVFGMDETFLKGDQKLDIDGYKWVGKNRTKKQKGGIGLLISENVNIYDDNVFETRDDDFERFWVKLKFDHLNKHVYVAVVYFPVEGVDHDLCDELYNKLLSEVIKIESLDDNDEPHILIIGDMNARIGDKIPFGDPIRNSNGNRLLTFCDDSDLSIINCSKMCHGKITWVRGSQKSTIDYLLGSESILNKVRKMIVGEDGDYHLGSDHNVLLLNLKPNKNTKNNISHQHRS